MIVHTGRRTGLRRRTVVEVIRYDGATGSIVVMSGFGRRSDWYRNIQAREATSITVGRHEFVPTHEELSEDEAVAAVAEYERRHLLAAPLIQAVISGLVGWKYDGTDAGRHRLVQHLPLVRFSPAGTAGETPEGA